MLSPVWVWRVSLGAEAPEGAGDVCALDAEERRRYEAFRFEADRRRFLLSHLALRRILGGGVRFERDPRGKPRLQGGELRFNLSHSGSLALVAVSRDCEVGVDVEQVRRNVKVELVARRFFAPGEMATLQGLSEPARTEAFFRCWVRKEAYLKAAGTGLTDALREIDAGQMPGWSIADLEVPPGYVAAVAAPRPQLAVRLCDWRGEAFSPF
ncbi:MAG: 4'-phosphopantetheinyl transferase superfamily protein [Acidobacteria bacterium]|nr:4'-phosphopantetheinyl transferase superfamily protein [Acidobacteriota bacterium]